MLDVFEFISSYINFPTDKVRYATLLLLSYPLGLIFRHFLHYSKTSPTVRHAYLGGLGLLFSILCFGWQTCFLFGVASLCYCLLYILPLNRVHWYTMIFAMVVLGIVHIYRMATDYEGWTLDYSGPFMIMVQKITYVGFSYHDGKTGRKDLSTDQEHHKLMSIPSYIEYMSYCFNFLSFLTGPSSTFIDYNEMVTGQNFKKYGGVEPSALLPALKKFGVAIVMLIVFIYFESFHDLKENIFDNSIPIYIKIFIIYFYSLSLRGRYYFAFYTAESVCNVAGFGFNGFDEFNNPKWDLVATVEWTGCEFPTNFRELGAKWNAATSKWLRRCIYERVRYSGYNGSIPVFMTFLVSAVWHGFYLVYYYTFFSFVLQIDAARKVRARVRPFFQSSLMLKTIYNIITTLTTIVFRDYSQLVFLFLNIQDALQLTSYYYHLPVLLSVLVVLFFPSNK